MQYNNFLKNKKQKINSVGFKIDRKDIHKKLFEFQKDIVQWCIRKGRAAIFADTGLGKTFMQLEWAKHIYEKIGGDILILAPLAVAEQTVREGKKINVEVNNCKQAEDVTNGINITNYEKLHKFNPDNFMAVVLDESSILKSYTSKTRNKIINSFVETEYKLACTATPAPNDFKELGNHSEFLGVMDRGEMLGMYFVHDGSRTSQWRLKGHAEDEYWKWVSNWAVMLNKPSDLGYKDGKFNLPPLKKHSIVLEPKEKPEETLFPVAAESLMERRRARRKTIPERTDKAAELVNESDNTWIVWCNLNDESSELANKISDAVEIQGTHSQEYKEQKMHEFTQGKIRVLVTKPSIAGFGMNWQHCNKVAFVGLSDSYERYYQAIRRCWRFGQNKPVDVYIITSKLEGNVLRNIEHKEAQAEEMAKRMIEHTKELTIDNLRGTHKETMEYKTDHSFDKDWDFYLGDSVEIIKDFEDESIDYTIFSPPFENLYTYTNSERDMGNCKDGEKFRQHFKFLVEELYRVTKPGRLLSFHCMNLPTTKAFDGVIGIKDFRGTLIDLFKEKGWIFHSEVCIWKDPVVAMQRTKALGLLYRQLKKDSSMSRQGIPDYLVTMRKPGDNPEPIGHKPDDFPLDEWRNIASPVWTDIDQSNTLQYRSARAEKDEKHICPLQLDVIERGLRLWSNKGDTILDPFAGIASTGYQSLKMDRKFTGIELKESYYEQGKNNLRMANKEKDRMKLFEV
ncbi:MAG: DEAD/DEAH box helicase [Halanaerobiales bacterium]|nr:DEAD/DEAH box helicase [Halanaerobiales bacterium]